MPTKPVKAASSGPADIDGCVLCILPWLASRYSPVSGSFFGQGRELDTPPETLAAQALAIFQALGIREQLPYIIQRKLASFPPQSRQSLRDSFLDSPLDRKMRKAVAGDAAAFASALRSFCSVDSGYTLEPGQGGPGLMAAAYLLLVEARPAWYAHHGFAAPPKLGDDVVTKFSGQLLPVFAP